MRLTRDGSEGLKAFTFGTRLDKNSRNDSILSMVKREPVE